MRTAGVMDSTNLLVRTDHESNGRFAFNYNAVRVIPNRADGKGPHELAVLCKLLRVIYEFGRGLSLVLGMTEGKK
jgi:hypothetical protein